MSASDKELRTDFTGDADSLVAAAGKAEKAYQGVADETKTLGRTMESTDDDVEAMADALADAMRKADKSEDSLSKMRQEIKKLQDSSSQAADSIPADFHKIDNELGDTSATFGETGKEAGSEFASNLAEGLSSGDLGSVARDTAFGLLTAFQSVPIAGQVAIGLTAAATAAWTIIQGQSEKAKQEISTLFDTFIQEGAQAVRNAVKNAGLEKLGGTVAQGWIDLRDIADQIGVSTGDLASTLDGDLLPVEQELYDTMKDEYDILLDKASTAEGLTKEESNRLNALGKILPIVEEQAGLYADTAEAAGVANDNLNKPIDQSGIIEYSDRVHGAKDDAAITKRIIESIDPRNITGGAFQGSSGGQVPHSAAASQAAGGAPVPPPAVHQHWSITVNNMQADPDRTVAAIERWARDNGRPGSVTATAS